MASTLQEDGFNVLIVFIYLTFVYTSRCEPPWISYMEILLHPGSNTNLESAVRQIEYVELRLNTKRGYFFR